MKYREITAVKPREWGMLERRLEVPALERTEWVLDLCPRYQELNGRAIFLATYG